MADSLLLETGDHLLLETGDRLLLEQSAGAGTMVAPLGGLSATITGKVIHAGTLVAGLGGLTGTASGLIVKTGTMAAGLGNLTGTLVGAPMRVGTMAATLGSLIATVYAVPFAPGSSIADLQRSPWDAELNDPPWYDDTVMSPWRADLARDRVLYGTGSSTLGSLTASLTGTVDSSILSLAVAGWRASGYSGSGDLLDLTGNGHDLVLHADFDFSTDHFVVTGATIPGGTPAAASPTKPDFGSGPMTVVVVWAEIGSGAGYLIDLSDDFSAPTGWSMYRSSLGFHSVLLDGYSVGFAQTTTLGVGPPDQAILHAYAGQMDASGCRVLIDAIEVEASDPKTWDDDNAAPLEVGGYMPVAAEFYGAALFDFLLSDAEIAEAGALLSP